MWLPIALPAWHFAPHDARIGLHGAADHEKRRAHVLGAQHGEDLVGVRRVRAVVVGERDDALVLRPANERLAEELVARVLDDLIALERQRRRAERLQDRAAPSDVSPIRRAMPRMRRLRGGDVVPELVGAEVAKVVDDLLIARIGDLVALNVHQILRHALGEIDIELLPGLRCPVLRDW